VAHDDSIGGSGASLVALSGGMSSPRAEPTSSQLLVHLTRPDARQVSFSEPAGRVATSSEAAPPPPAAPAAAQIAAGQPRVRVDIRAEHLGGFIFKGTELTEMVAVYAATLCGRAAALPRAAPKGGKGRRVTARVGTAAAASALLPDLLSAPLRERFLEVAAEQAAAPGIVQEGAGGEGAGTGALAGEGPPAAESGVVNYGQWLAAELTQRQQALVQQQQQQQPQQQPQQQQPQQQHQHEQQQQQQRRYHQQQHARRAASR
jgi:hypothetical protein